MKKKSLSLLSVVCALCLIFFACRKEIGQFVKPGGAQTSAEKLEAAKIWNAQFIAKNISENSKQPGFVTPSPEWDQAWTVKTLDNLEYLAVPTTVDYIDQLKVSISRLYLFQLKGNAVASAEIVEYVGLNGYNIGTNQDRLIQNQNNQSITGFDGAIIHYDLNYRWTGGYIFENGSVKLNNAAITRQMTFAQPASNKKQPLYLSTLSKDGAGNFLITNYKYLFTPVGRLRLASSGSGSGSGYTSNGGNLSGVTIIGTPGGGTSGGGGGGGVGGNPPPTGGGGTGGGSTGTTSGNGTYAGSDGTATLNGQQDPDFPSNCASWAYMPVSLGDYQVCGVLDLRFDFVTEWQANGTIHLDYVRCDFTKILYFEFPRKRITGEFISAGLAAQLTAQAKDNAEEILESQVEASPPPTSATAVQTLLTRYYNILNNELKAYGGRVSYNNNYGTTSVQPYTKSITGGNCN